MMASREFIRKTIAITLVILVFVLAVYLGIRQKNNDSTKQVMPSLSEEMLSRLNSDIDPTFSGLYSESKPLTGDDVTETDTFTSQYFATLEADIDQEEILNRDRINAFINLNKGELLTEVSIAEDMVLPSSTDANKATYLDQISPGINPDLNIITSDMIDQFFADQLSSDPTFMQDMVKRMEQNVEVLNNISVPKEFIALHQKNLAANKSLLENTKRLRDINDDFIGSLIGSYNISQLSHVFREIAEEINTLREGL